VRIGSSDFIFVTAKPIQMKDLFDLYALKTAVRLFAIISLLFFLVNYFA
jgi:hypothetical protein